MRGKGKKPKISCPERMAFLQHRWRSKKERQLGFHFTYEEWLGWWKHNLGDDWFTKRGHSSGQYVMARYGDKGPYAPWNVKCITVEQNVQEARHNLRGNAKLTKDQVASIYRAHGTYAGLARQYHVGECTIRDIKKRYTWRHVTDLLD